MTQRGLMLVSPGGGTVRVIFAGDDPSWASASLSANDHGQSALRYCRHSSAVSSRVRRLWAWAISSSGSRG
jgi:hypothetical protein